MLLWKEMAVDRALLRFLRKRRLSLGLTRASSGSRLSKCSKGVSMALKRLKVNPWATEAAGGRSRWPLEVENEKKTQKEREKKSRKRK
jgi:hypothetical protein